MKEYIPPSITISSIDVTDIISTSDEVPMLKSFHRSKSFNDAYDSNDNYFDNE